MKVVYLVVGAVDCESSMLFGAYSDEGKAKKRRDAVIKNGPYADQYFLHEMVLDQDTEDHI